MSARRVFSWIKRLFHWLAELRFLFWNAAFLLAVVCGGFLLFHGKETPLFIGYALQGMGMVYAIHGLIGIRDNLADKSLFREFWEWFKGWMGRFPRWRQHVIASGALASSDAFAGEGHASSWNPDKPELSTDQRFELVYRNFEVLREQYKSLLTSDIALRRELSRIEAERQKQFESSQREIRDTFKRIHVYSFAESLVGLSYVFIGIVISSLAEFVL